MDTEILNVPACFKMLDISIKYSVNASWIIEWSRNCEIIA